MPNSCLAYISVGHTTCLTAFDCKCSKNNVGPCLKQVSEVETQHKPLSRHTHFITTLHVSQVYVSRSKCSQQRTDKAKGDCMEPRLSVELRGGPLFQRPSSYRPLLHNLHWTERARAAYVSCCVLGCHVKP